MKKSRQAERGAWLEESPRTTTQDLRNDPRLANVDDQTVQTLSSSRSTHVHVSGLVIGAWGASSNPCVIPARSLQGAGRLLDPGLGVSSVAWLERYGSFSLCPSTPAPPAKMALLPRQAADLVSCLRPRPVCCVSNARLRIVQSAICAPTRRQR